MNNNNIMKTTTYGEQTYKIYYDITVTDKDGIQLRKHTKNIALYYINPYIIQINKNKELFEMIERYKHIIGKYITYDKETQRVRGNRICLKYIKVKKSLYSYIRQEENNIKQQFVRHSHAHRTDYYVTGYNPKILQYNKDFNTMIRVTPISNTEQSNKTAYDMNVHIKNREVTLENGEKYKLRIENVSGNKILRKTVTREKNEYEKFKTLLEHYFKEISDNNEGDWKQYLNQRTRDMLKYMQEDSLQQLQNDYKKAYDEKIKQRKELIQ